MTDYTTISCKVGRSRRESVWVVLDDGHRSENIPLSTIHPDDVAQIHASDHWRAMQLRIKSDMAKTKNLISNHHANNAHRDLFSEPITNDCSRILTEPPETTL